MLGPMKEYEVGPPTTPIQHQTENFRLKRKVFCLTLAFSAVSNISQS